MFKFFFLFALFCSASANAFCTKGGYDGNDLAMGGCSSIGEYGNLYYDRDSNNLVTQKFDNESVKKKITDYFNSRFKNHGVKLDQGSFKFKDNLVTFDVLENNGDKIMTYVIDRATGIPTLEQKLVTSKKEKISKDQIRRQERQEKLKRLKQLTAELNVLEEQEKQQNQQKENQKQ